MYIQLPLIQDLMSTKIQQLPVRQRSKFQAKLLAYDSEVGKIVATMKQCLNKIGRKQHQLADTFGELIDVVLRAEIYSSYIEDNMTQPCNASVPGQLSFSSHIYVYFMQTYDALIHSFQCVELATQSGDQFVSEPLMTPTQMESHMTHSQVESLVLRQQKVRRVLESCLMNPLDLVSKFDSYIIYDLILCI
jgi:hypothetical protein